MTDEINNSITVADDGVEFGFDSLFNEVIQDFTIELMGIVVDKFPQVLVCRDDVMAFCEWFFNDIAASCHSDRIIDLRRS